MEKKILPKFKCRCSAIGKLMTSPTGKSNEEKYQDALVKLEALKAKLEGTKNKSCQTAIDLEHIKIPEQEILCKEFEKVRFQRELSQTAKSYLKEWVIEHIYGVKREIKAKQITKGNEMENLGIDRAIEWLDLPFVIKNEFDGENEWFTGHWDIETPDEILDTKLPWDCFTHPIFEPVLPTDDYYGQGQGYMNLTGKRKFRVVYVLLDTPPSYENPEGICYDDIPVNLRHVEFPVEYDEEYIAEAKNRVLMAREYIKELVRFKENILITE